MRPRSSSKSFDPTPAESAVIYRNSWLKRSISSHILPVLSSQYKGKKPSILRNPSNPGGEGFRVRGGRTLTG